MHDRSGEKPNTLRYQSPLLRLQSEILSLQKLRNNRLAPKLDNDAPIEAYTGWALDVRLPTLNLVRLVLSATLLLVIVLACNLGTKQSHSQFQPTVDD